MNISTSILKSVITNVERDVIPADDYGIAWYRGMISAAQHDDLVDGELVKRATLAVDGFSARRSAQVVPA